MTQTIHFFLCLHCKQCDFPNVIALTPYRTYPALETLTEPHQLTATLSCVIGVARSLVSGGKWFPEGPTHMLPLLMRALPGVDPNDFSKCMVSISVLPLLRMYLTKAFRLS